MTIKLAIGIIRKLSSKLLRGVNDCPQHAHNSARRVASDGGRIVATRRRTLRASAQSGSRLINHLSHDDVYFCRCRTSAERNARRVVHDGDIPRAVSRTHQHLGKPAYQCMLFATSRRLCTPCNMRARGLIAARACDRVYRVTCRDETAALYRDYIATGNS